MAEARIRHSARNSAESMKSTARAIRLDVEAEDFLVVGEAVIAAKAHVVAEEGQKQRIGHRLGDDRQIDAIDAGAEGEPAEDEGEQTGTSRTMAMATGK